MIDGKKKLGKEICYIILTYNNPSNAIETLNGILSQSIINEIDIFIIDNSSTHKNRILLENYAGQHNVNYIYRTINDGYAGGNNYAWKLFRDKYKFLYFVNDDIVFRSDKLTAVINKIFETNPNIGLIGPEVFIDNEHTIKKNNRQRFFFDKSIYGHKFIKYKYYSEVDSVIGCFMALRTSVNGINELFDESFFMYSEEFDLCLRIWKNGYRVAKITDKNYSIYHKGGNTPKFENGGYWKEYLGNRNAVLCLKNLRFIEKIKMVIFLIFSGTKKMISKRDRRYKKSAFDGYIHGAFILLTCKEFSYIRSDAERSVKKYA